MTEQELRARVCRQAERWLGCRESDGSHRPIIDIYNRIRPLPRGYKMTYDDPWCAAFVSAVGAACELTDTILPECGCEPMIALYQAAGRWEEADDAAPRPGDLIFYDWEDSGTGDCVGAADHVGLVTENDDDLLTVIEGNLSDAVGRRRIYAGARFIRGYARPDYLSAAATSVGEGLAPPADAGTNPTVAPASAGAGAPDGPQSLPLEEKVPPQGVDEVPPSPSSPASPVIANQSGPASPERGGVAGACAGDGGVWCGNPSPPSANSELIAASPSPDSALTPLPLLRRGDRGAAVRSAQLLLIARGYRCGPWGADGDFGAATLGAVYRFQQGRRLAMDGELGPQTWAKLVGEKE